MTLQEHFLNSRLLFQENNVIDLYLSLKTSPLLIFTGISGSGKTKFAQYFTEYMVTSFHPLATTSSPSPAPFIDKHRISFVSVRPDWLDNKGMLGYYNPLLGEYSITPVLQLLLNALNEPNEPFFLILDEMNLAKAEYYFSDFLSAIESRRFSPVTGQYEAESINLHNAGSKILGKHYSNPEEKEVAIVEMNSLPYDCYVHITPTLERKYFVPENITVPRNLYVIGTVNIDESTYRFSPKIIDRAHTIEMNGATPEEYISYLTQPHSAQSSSTKYNRLNFSTNDLTHNSVFLSTKLESEILNDASIDNTLLQETIACLGGLLNNTAFKFSYRTSNQIIQFIGNGKELWDLSGINFDKDELLYLLDSTILLKILPRIHGQRRILEPLLKNLIYFCSSNFSKSDYDEIIEGNQPQNSQNLDFETFSPDQFRFPRSAKSIFRIYNSMVKENANYGSFV